MFDSRLNIGNGTFSWQNDVLNRLMRETYSTGDYIEYTYNTAGRRATLLGPDGSIQTYSYDARGRLSTFDHSLGNKTFTFGHNNDNTLSSVLYPNYITNAYTYDTLYRPGSINVYFESDYNNPFYLMEYDYDANGNRTTAAWPSGQGAGLPYDYTKHYTYDAMGRRLMKYLPATNMSTLYLYEGLTTIAEKEKVGSGSWRWKRVFTVSPGVIGQIQRVSDNTGSSWAGKYFHYDAIGNVALHTASDGSPVQAFDQDAYGNVRLGSQSGYHLTTKEFDPSADLYYFWQRWYDPGIGRFLSKAPYPKHIKHPYGCAANNPVYYIDSDGAQPTAEQRTRCWCDFILCLENAQPDYRNIGILGLFERGLSRLLPKEFGESILPPAFWSGAVIGVWGGMVRCYAEYEGCLAGYSGNSEPERTLPPQPLPPDEWEFRPGRIPISRNRR